MQSQTFFLTESDSKFNQQVSETKIIIITIAFSSSKVLLLITD